MRFYTPSMTKRAYSRYPVEGSATLIDLRGTEEPLILKDISCSGAGVIASQALGINDKTDIIISASSLFAQPIRRKARVAWCQRVAVNLWQSGLDFGEAGKIPLFNNALP